MLKDTVDSGNKKSFTVHDLPLAERPRERMLKFGASALSVQEILALILGRGIKGESVMVTAQNLLGEFKTIDKIAAASVAELSRVRGIGIAKATQLKAAFELSRRLDGTDDLYAGANIKNPGPAIKSPEDMMRYVGEELKGKLKEHFQIILLNTRNQIIGKEEISVGSLNTSIVHPREVFKAAIAASAAAIILVHNHPSGDPQPSEDDIKLTKRLSESGLIMGIDVLDHIIICNNKYLSLKSKGLF